MNWTLYCRKLAGVRVEEFSLGFGPTLFKKETEETLYSIRLFRSEDLFASGNGGSGSGENPIRTSQ